MSERRCRTYAEHRQSLERHGYQEVPEYAYRDGVTIRPGDRIRHRGQQYRKARWHGTSTIVAIYERPDSAWSRSWRMDDVEVIHHPDDAPDGECPITWAQYHLDLITARDREFAWCGLRDGHEGSCRRPEPRESR